MSEFYDDLPSFSNGSSAIEGGGRRSGLFCLVGRVHDAFTVILIGNGRRQGHAIIIGNLQRQARRFG